MIDGDVLVTLYLEWRRLRGYPPPAKTPIDAMIDDAAGVGLEDRKILEEFALFVRNYILERL